MSKDYMKDIYGVIDEPEVEYDNDNITYLDEPEDIEMNLYDNSLSWADDITYLDEPEDDGYNLDLGDDCIPIYQGDEYQEELIVIDEYYMLDEFELDLVENYNKYDKHMQKQKEYSYNDIYNLLDDDDSLYINPNDAESIIKIPGDNEPQEEELKNVNVDDETSALALSIAKEHMDNVKAGEAVGVQFGDIETPEDDTNWVKDDNDLFGNDISVIIAEDPNKEVEEDFAEGSFSDWLAQQNQ